MGFPKVPKKPITGNLRLVIRSPETRVDIGPEPDLPETEDLSDSLQFKLPRGFQLDTDYSGVLDRMYIAGTKRINSIRDRYVNCSNCRKITSEDTLVIAERILAEADIFLREFNGEGVSYVVGHTIEGAITIDFNKGSRDLLLQVEGLLLDIRHFESNKLVFEKEEWPTPTGLLMSLRWLLGE